MKKKQSNSVETSALFTRRSALQLALSAGATYGLVACGGGGVVQPTGQVANGAARTLSADFVSRKAVNYSPYRTNNNATEVPTAANVLQDLQLLVAAGFTLIRLFNSSAKEAGLILQVINSNSLPIIAQLGAYLQGESRPWLTAAQVAANQALNAAEIANCINLANKYPNIVKAVSVGNETMVSWQQSAYCSTAVVANYIKTVRSQISQPITSDDNWALWSNQITEQDPQPVLDVIDYVSMHTYTYTDTTTDPGKFDWRQASVPAASRAQAMVNACITAAQGDYNAVRAHLNTRGLTTMPITIGETGWKGVAADSWDFRTHPANQKLYYWGMMSWLSQAKISSGPANMFIFEAFDEPWKGGDDGWGLFNVSRQARYVIQGLVAGNSTLSNWDTVYTDADAVYWQPAVNTVVLANQFTVISDGAPVGNGSPSGTGSAYTPAIPLQWSAWNNGTTASITGGASAGQPILSSASLPVPYYQAATSTAAAINLTQCYQITPNPSQDYWGMAYNLESGTAQNAPVATADLSTFANGTLNFLINTTYPGLIRVGFYTGRFADSSGIDCYISIHSGQFGYASDGYWHLVSIPIQSILPLATDSNGNAATADLTQVSSPIVFSDTYSKTGKPSGANITTPIQITGVYWLK